MCDEEIGDDPIPFSRKKEQPVVQLDLEINLGYIESRHKLYYLLLAKTKRSRYAFSNTTLNAPHPNHTNTTLTWRTT